MKSIQLHLLLLLIMLGGCHTNLSSEETRSVDSAEEKPTSVPFRTPASAEISTGTQVEDSSRGLRNQCLQVRPRPAYISEASEGIVLKDYRQENRLVLFTSSGEDGYLLAESGGYLTNAAVSPSGIKLAYRAWATNDNTSNLIIANSHGDRLASLPWEDDWIQIIEWVNDHDLAIMRADEMEPSRLMVIVNPFTHERKSIDFAEFHDLPPMKRPWLAFDPAMQLVLIPQYDAQALYDLAQQQILARIPAWIDQDPEDTTWSKNGQYAAIKGRNPYARDSSEIYLVNREGEFKQLTHLSEYQAGFYPSLPSWSPDGEQIALWIWDKAGSSSNMSLAVTDRITGQITNYCVVTDPLLFSGPSNESLPAPIWSPDSNKLVVEQRYSPDHSHVVSVNISDGTAEVIYDDARPIGWMTEQP